MFKQSTILSGIAIVGLLLNTTSGGSVASMAHGAMQPITQSGEFRRIEQPLWVKGSVTAGGLGLIGLELWWFLFSYSPSNDSKKRRSN